MHRMSLPKLFTPRGGGADVASSEAEDKQDCAIRVVIRARPLNERELLGRTPVIVSVDRTSVKVVNPTLFHDPVYLEAVATTTAGRRASISDLPIALTETALQAAVSAGECRTFHFDRCIGVDSAAGFESGPIASTNDVDAETQKPNQELIFEEIGRDMLASAFEGFNCTVLAYGQTGSGKTHTMLGDKTDAGKGVIPRFCEALFQGIDARRCMEHEQSSASAAADDSNEYDHSSASDLASSAADSISTPRSIYSVHVSYCEIYMEKVQDLLELGMAASSNNGNRRSSFSLSPTNGNSDDSANARRLKVREHPITGPFVEGLTCRSVNSYAEIAEEMLAGDKLRTVASTQMNAVSSRSHAVFTITLTQTTFDPATQSANDKTSKICMIDLAGSERANVSGTSGDRLKEGAMINKSLTTLGRVISALSKGSAERVPYRDSTLTWLLKESLGGNAKTTMIAMISPSSENYDETMSTLRYAESAKRVINRAVVNEDRNARIIRQLRQEIQELRAELARNRHSPKKPMNNAGLSASLAEREQFYAELQQEMNVSEPLQQQLQLEEIANRREQNGSIQLNKTRPSLVNLSPNLRADEPLAYCLTKGVTVMGSDPSIRENREDSSPGSAVGSELSVITSGENESPPSPRKGNRGSWSPSFLKRKTPSLSDFPIEASSSSTSPRQSPTRPRLSRAHSSPTGRQAPVRQLNSSSPDGMQYLMLCHRDGISARHAQFYCVHSEYDGEDEPFASVEVEAMDSAALILVNNRRIGGGAETRVKLKHGDQIQLGTSYCFRLHIPQHADTASSTFGLVHSVAAPIAEEDQSNDGMIAHTDDEEECEDTRTLAELVDEANAICTKWHLSMVFDCKDEDDASYVIVKKRTSDNKWSVTEWTRATMRANLQNLQHFVGTLEDTPKSSFGTDDNASSDKGSSTRLAEYASDEPVDSLASAGGILSSEISSTSLEAVPEPTCVRLLGHGRIFVGSVLDLSTNSAISKPLNVGVYDATGKTIGTLAIEMTWALKTTSERRSGGTGFSRLSGGKAKANLEENVYTLQIEIKQLNIEASASNMITPEGVSLTLKNWAGRASKSDDGTAAQAMCSTPKVFSASDPHGDATTTLVFQIQTMFKTSFVSVLDKTPGSEQVLEKPFVSVELWGYGPLLPSLAVPRASISSFSSRTQSLSLSAVRKLDVYISVDVDECGSNGQFSPAVVKSDGALRLHVNQSRRLSVRITQADHQPFSLQMIQCVYLSSCFPVDVAGASAFGKSTPWLLSAASSVPPQARMAGSEDPTWRALEFKAECVNDSTNRTLVASLRWDGRGIESVDDKGSRSVFRVVVVFTTDLSPVPIALAKSVATKFCGNSVSMTQKWARDREASRTAWWARESFSRSYRLGTWYAVELSTTNNGKNQSRNNSSSSRTCEATADQLLSSSVDLAKAQAVRCIQGLRDMELVLVLERMQQQMVTMMLSSKPTSDTTDALITLEYARDCLDRLFEMDNESELRFEVVELFRGRFFLRSKAKKEFYVELVHPGRGASSTDLTDQRHDSFSSSPSASPHRRSLGPITVDSQQQVAHFVTEPPQFAGGVSSEMCGFLMFDSSFQRSSDTPATAAATIERESRNELKKASALGRWERRWFVLKRPFLYGYKSFARKEQLGVLDISKAQVFVAPTEDQAAIVRGGDAKKTQSIAPFCFQLVCLAGNKRLLWSFQASTAAEMRAWLVAIDPLKIVARESILNSQSNTSVETPALTA